MGEKGAGGEENENRNVPPSSPLVGKGRRNDSKEKGSYEIGDYFFFLPFGGPTFSLPLVF